MRFFNKPDDEAFDYESTNAFLESINILKERLVCTFFLKTGISAAELIKLRWSDIETSNQRVMVYDSNLKRIRNVYTPRDIVDMLNRLRNNNGLGNETIFPVTERQLNTIVGKWTNIFNGKSKSVHSLRLAYIFGCASNRIPIEVVAENMGVPPTQLFKYWHHTPEEVRAMINKKERE